MTTTKRQATPKVTVAWCPDCKMQSSHLEEIGGSCWNTDCLQTLVKRVGYLCMVPLHLGFHNDPTPCQMFHRTIKAMKECEHNAY